VILAEPSPCNEFHSALGADYVVAGYTVVYRILDVALVESVRCIRRNTEVRNDKAQPCLYTSSDPVYTVSIYTYLFMSIMLQVNLNQYQVDLTLVRVNLGLVRDFPQSFDIGSI